MFLIWTSLNFCFSVKREYISEMRHTRDYQYTFRVREHIEQNGRYLEARQIYFVYEQTEQVGFFEKEARRG